MNKFLYAFTAVVLFVALAATGWKTWQQARAHETETRVIIDHLRTTSQLENTSRKLLEILSLGIYDGYSQAITTLNKSKKLREDFATSVRLLTWAFLTLTVVLLLLVWRQRRQLSDVAHGLLGVALIALTVGLITPILSIEASRNLPLLGETVFQYQSKGILSTLVDLNQRGYWWLALVMLVFSVLVPMLKTLIGFLTWADYANPFLERWFHFSHHLGKWSMADVFVVAVLVVFFANSNANALTHAEVRAGLWFFLFYVIFSLIAFQILSFRVNRLSSK